MIAEIYTYYYGDYDEARKIYDNVMMNIVGNDITLGALEKDIMRSVIKKELERINTLEQNGF